MLSFSFSQCGSKFTEEKVKKPWIVVDAKTHKKEDIQKETVYCLNDDDETEVQKEDVIQGMTSVFSREGCESFYNPFFAQFRQNENALLWTV